jgi:hypothetical protein
MPRISVCAYAGTAKTTSIRFVQNVIDHIGAAVYVDRQTGLLKLKLIRKDYDASAMTAYTFDNGILGRNRGSGVEPRHDGQRGHRKFQRSGFR